MGKYTGPICKLCRREGEKLFLKGQRCYTPKCAFERRGFPPGEHGREGQFRQRRKSDYQRQLREKQKTRRVYGVSERQFRRYFRTALQKRGLTGEILLTMLERRLDNVIYRLGYASSRAQARQLVTHGHFSVNDRRTDIPSMLVRPGDRIDVREGSRSRVYFKDLAAEAETRNVPAWLDRDLAHLSAKVLQNPDRRDVDTAINEQLIIEYYSR
jgi:small subunit ribosomal protein S4